jgi:rhamnogalacturonyl hydrolase YesR
VHLRREGNAIMINDKGVRCWLSGPLLLACLGAGGCRAGARETWSPPPRPLIHKAARAVIRDFPESPPFNWGEGVLMAGMMRAGVVLQEPAYVDFVRRWADHWRRVGIGALMAERGYCGHWGPGLPLLMLHEYTGDRAYLQMAEEILAFMQTRAFRTSEGFPGPNNQFKQVWVDVLFMCCPVYTHMARATSRPELIREGATLLDICARRCQDGKTGLFYHMYDEPSGKHVGPLWARGNGWVTMSYVEILRSLDRNSPDFKKLSAQFGRQVDGILSTQDPATGLWHTLQDRPDTYLETSATAMFLYGLVQAQRGGFVHLDARVLDRTWAGLANKVDEAGRVFDVSAGTDARNEVDRYITKPRGTFTWGTGAFLLAATELISEK